MKTNLWRGIAIAESFIDGEVIAQCAVVKTITETLEGEAARGEFHFHNVEVAEGRIEDVVNMAMKTLKPGWYIHFVKDDRMFVAFSGKYFLIAKDDQESLEGVKKYALCSGIHPEQINGLEILFDNPFDE